MRASRDKIMDWIMEGGRQLATHVIVVCDSFDYTDYPVYVRADQDALAVAESYRRKDMQRVVEIIELASVFGDGYKEACARDGHTTSRA